MLRIIINFVRGSDCVAGKAIRRIGGAWDIYRLGKCENSLDKIVVSDYCCKHKWLLIFRVRMSKTEFCVEGRIRHG